MSNRLKHASSPYLLQHAENPVDWYPWSDEALQRARDEQKPIFLSIGYSACHWCHVMEHESFEDDAIAATLNENFVCIKVDREERPDLDQIYMLAVQIMTGRGGWPMSVFLTPDLQPFFGGTYWPPSGRMGMPGFNQVLAAVIDAWANRRTLAVEQAASLTERMGALAGHDLQPPGSLTLGLLDGASMHLERVLDRAEGGFGGAPKFPHAMDLQLLLRIWSRSGRSQLLHAVDLTLDKMAGGGIYDHLGGGFARYSVDAKWLVPHFEKMLYDNALLAATYTDSYLATGNEKHRRVAQETLDYVLRDMTDRAGGFYAAEDADSEGVEGKFYVWSRDEIESILGEQRAARFCAVYDVSEFGNFEGHNILNLPQPIDEVAGTRNWSLDELLAELSEDRDKLLAVRGRRVRPGRDDKVIVAWNGLMIDALSRAARAFDEPRYAGAAASAATFLHEQMWQSDRLLHSWRQGVASLPAYLDDYATLANGLVSLYEATFNERWLKWACELVDQTLEHFGGAEGSALYYTADDHEQLILRNKDLQDNAAPSGNAMAAMALVRLGHLTSNNAYLQAAEQILSALVPIMDASPSAAGQALIATDLLLGPVTEFVIVALADGSETKQCLSELNQQFRPRSVVALRSTELTADRCAALDALFENRTSHDEIALYVCQNQTCAAPAIGIDAARAMLHELP
ncbi:MAG: thioredoxin domain-containing protein [Planctomycetales bacterium]|nr:thioredoxin domain-containing protein [Planctomycetales bacterium]MCA9166665.1 thioredoxin domain-containing protein [Planctomycetales bacterium]